MHTITDDEFRPLIKPYLKDFISLYSAITQMKPRDIPRPLIGRLLLEASKCEEMLDAYGATRNKKWSPIRTAVATAKSFSRVIYNLFHLLRTLPQYKLINIGNSFTASTEKTLETLLCSIAVNAECFMRVASKLQLTEDLWPIEHYGFQDVAIHGRLKANQQRKIVQNPKETAMYLATNMLNLVEKSSWLNVYKTMESNKYHASIPDVISEEKLRLLANNFHSLQSLYDTYLSGSDIAEKDEKLPGIRGNISVVFHLLDTAVTLIHFYERHALRNWNRKLRTPLSNSELLEIIISYFVKNAVQFISSEQSLCQDILRTYSTQSEIKTPIPNYRGFHVRPSTLISKIVTHYGSDVKMILDNKEYDASMPLELFRANEVLNKRKRDTIVRYVMEHTLLEDEEDAVFDKTQMKHSLRMIFFDMLKKQRIMNYTSTFAFEDIDPYEDETLAEFVKRVITRYLAAGNIDIISNDKVVFQGDMRVLEDIRIFAESGYGEDKFGNNTVLPEQLSYLKR